MHTGLWRLMVAGLLGAGAAPAWAEDAATLAARFGALEAVRQMALSPSGSQVAYVATIGPAQVLYVADVASGGDSKGILKQVAGIATMRHCNWATDEHLLCYVNAHRRRTGVIQSGNNMFIVSRDGKEVRSLSGENAGDAVIDWGTTPGHVLAVSYGNIEDIDLATRNRRQVEDARRGEAEVMTDGHGTLRVMATYGQSASDRAKATLFYFYRKPGERLWNDLSIVRTTAEGLAFGFTPYAVDSAKNLAYGFDDHDGRRALYSVRLDGSNQKELVLSRADVDVDGLVRIGRHQRVVGATYATERRVREYFDPELRKLAHGLEQALPGHPTVEFVDASEDEGKLLIFAGSDIDPGSYYLYDKPSRRLGSLLPVRPQLAGLTLAPMQPVTLPAADGTTIPGYLTLPPGGGTRNLPAIVMPHGGPAARDEWGFDWLVQFFAARGFAVIQPNYRGSAGYGAQWYQKNGFRSWRMAIGDVNDAARWLVSQGIADPKRLAIVGWSYGGYAALQAQVADPDLYRASVAIAPVTDLAQLKFDEGWSTERLIGSGPHVTEGSPAANAARFKAPVLMFHGDNDLNVEIEQSRRMAARLRAAGKAVELVEYPGLAHALESAKARADMLVRADAFLRKALDIP